MLKFSNKSYLIQDPKDLPNLTGAHTVYVDFETTSGAKDKMSVNPWFNCSVAGFAITVDDDPRAYYVPVNHFHGGNIDRRAAIKWLKAVLDSCVQWVNHNIKYDLHVAENDFQIKFAGRIIDTLPLCKLYNSDRFSYDMDQICKDWLDYDISEYEQALAPYLGGDNNKDYGRVPVDVMAKYGCEDVHAVRAIWLFLQKHMYECQAWDIEINTTPILHRIERTGMTIDPKMIRGMEILYIKRMFELRESLLDETGKHFNPVSNNDCYDVLCNQYGLPVLKWTNEDNEDKESNPSFAKDVMQQYITHPGAPIDVVKQILEYRTKSTFHSLFLTKYGDLNVGGVLHPSYNQTVRTGRMSCREPNAQQLNKDAKRLILPEEGCEFLSIDYSQIEFRTIAHYINNRKTIEAYRANPDTDFHQWVANLCGIPRKPAKSVNFCMGYGGGKNRLIQMLMKDEDLMAEFLGLGYEEFMHKASAKAEAVYNGYHGALPELRRVSGKASAKAKERGYVFNLVGRRRHLDRRAYYRAFNALNQGLAADLMKERLPIVEQVCDRWGLRMVAIVHDEILFMTSPGSRVTPQMTRDLIEVMEQPGVELNLPIRCSYGTSDKSWYHCGLTESTWDLEDSPWHGHWTLTA